MTCANYCWIIVGFFFVNVSAQENITIEQERQKPIYKWKSPTERELGTQNANWNKWELICMAALSRILLPAHFILCWRMQPQHSFIVDKLGPQSCNHGLSAILSSWLSYYSSSITIYIHTYTYIQCILSKIRLHENVFPWKK